MDDILKQLLQEEQELQFTNLMKILPGKLAVNLLNDL